MLINQQLFKIIKFECGFPRLMVIQLRFPAELAFLITLDSFLTEQASMKEIEVMPKTS